MTVTILNDKCEKEDKDRCFKEQILALDPNKIPYHVAIVMDGNRRWAKKNKFGYLEGHRRGAENLVQIVEAAAQIGIKVLTVYAFSTENWNRSKKEVDYLMRLFQRFLKRNIKELKEKNARFHVIGDKKAVPKKLQQLLEQSIEDTKDNNKIDLVVAINYGGRDEITRALKNIMRDYTDKKIDLSDLSEELISSYLDTAPWPDPDLLIRTSGELRLSNFLLWQMSYAEFYAVDTLWPDFSKNHLFEAVIEYQKRERRFGKK